MSDFKGLVLTNTTLNDHDVIMNVLTENGIVSVKAKGVLKANSKNRNVTEIGCYSLFHTIDRLNQKVYLLKNAETIQRFSINTDLDKQAVYNCLLEGFNKTSITLDEAIKFVELLDKCDNPLCLYAFYLCYLIKNGGISLIVDRCSICGSQQGINGLSFNDGGFVCKSCYSDSKHMHLDIVELKNIRYCMHASLNDYQKLEENTNITFVTIKYLYQFIYQYGEIMLKSHSFLEILQSS